MRRARRFLVQLGLAASVALAYSCGAPAEAPASSPSGEETMGDPRLAFLGVWDRAAPGLRAASEATRIPMAWLSGAEVAAGADDVLAPYSVVFILNFSPAEAPGIRERVLQAQAASPELRVIALDHRDAHAPLSEAELLHEDSRVQDYWRYGGPRNFEGLLEYAAVTYLGEERTPREPEVVPEDGLYHPDAESLFDDVASYRTWLASSGHAQEGPTITFLVHQSFVILGDTRVVDTIIHAFEARGVNVATVFASNEALAQELILETDPALLMTQRHSALGRAADGSPLIPQQLDIPYLKPISMVRTTVDTWREDPRGLNPADVGRQMVLQELDGVIEPVIVGGLVADTMGYRLHEPIPERVERFVGRAMAWLHLRQTENADRRVFIVYYNKYLGRSDVGRGSPSGAYLNGPRSLALVLQEMQRRGYTMHDVPADEDALLARMMSEGRNIAVWAQGDLQELVEEHDPALVPVATYREWFDSKLTPELQQEVIARYGEPPGEIMTITRGGEEFIVIPRVDLGNVVIAPQPDRGPNQDPDLLHARDVPPPHQYLAFYWWMQEEFAADAVVHFGTHGSVELLPLKAAGLSGEDYGDIVLGDVPNIYPWILDNLGEGSLAKRRASAILIDHLVPPIVAVGLERELGQLHDDIDRLETLEPGLLYEQYRRSITDQAREARLLPDVAPSLAGPDAEDRPMNDDEIHELAEYLHRVHNNRTPVTLHTMGQVPELDLLVPYIESILGRRFLEHMESVVRLPRDVDAIAGEREKILGRRGLEVLRALLVDGHAPAEAIVQALGPGRTPSPELLEDLVKARDLQARIGQSGDEIERLFGALAGNFVPPGPGNDPIRNDAVLPTGRNLYAVNPNEIPTPPAWEAGQLLVQQLLDHYQERDGRLPHKIGIDLNGMETMRNYGVDEAQILSLLGCRPVWDENRVVVDVELIPDAELGRPRIDVFIQTAGTYRDNFPSRMELLDRAVRLASAAGGESNFVQEGTANTEASLLEHGYGPDDARNLAHARIFGQAPGEYGTRILHLLPRSGVWGDRNEVARVYRENMSYVFTEGLWGERREGLYETAAQGTEAVVRSWSSNMMSPLSNHHVYEYLGGFSMAIADMTGEEPEAFVADVRDPGGVELREFQEVLRMELHSRLFSEQWIRGMMENDYAGAGQMTELVKNTFGWAVTRPNDVGDDVWERIAEVYIEDRYELGLREWFAEENPHALQEMAATMLEAARKGMWDADEETLAEVARAYVENVAEHGESGGLVTGGNTALEEYVERVFEAPGRELPAELAERYRAALARSRGSQAPGSDEAAADPRVEGAVMREVGQAAARERQTWIAAGFSLTALLFVLGFAARRRSGRRSAPRRPR